MGNAQASRNARVHFSRSPHLFGGGRGGGTSLTSEPARAQRVADLQDPTRDLYPLTRNEKFTLDRPITDEKVNTNFNNFYEFGSTKTITKAAQALKLRPWTVKIDGMVEKAFEIGLDDLVRRMPLEERLYRHRCVEAWSMAIPWGGFPLAKLLDLAKPLSSANLSRMETFLDPSVAPGQRQTWYPWPYVEGLTIAEAGNELAFLVTGAYGEPGVEAAGRPATACGAVEVRLQIDKIDRTFQLHRPAAEELLGGAAGEEIRIMGQRQSAGHRICAGARQPRS